MIKELKYDLSKEDMEKGLRNFPVKSGINSIQIFSFLIVVLFAVIFGMFFREFIFSSLIIVFFLILIFLPKRKISFIKILGNFENQKFNLIINSDENTFTNKNDVSTTVFNWDKILKIDNTESSLLIFTGTNQVIIIPKRIFESEQEMNETWELIQECYNKNREDIR